MNTEKATAIVGLYTFGVYALALPGGWIADRLIGQKKAVLYGGVLIAAGHYALAIPASTSFYVGLFLIVVHVMNLLGVSTGPENSIFGRF